MNKNQQQALIAIVLIVAVVAAVLIITNLSGTGEASRLRVNILGSGDSCVPGHVTDRCGTGLTCGQTYSLYGETLGYKCGTFDQPQGYVCAPRGINFRHYLCVSATCNEAEGTCAGFLGDKCVRDSECNTNLCQQNRCTEWTPKSAGSRCQHNSGCLSNLCVFDPTQGTGTCR